MRKSAVDEYKYLIKFTETYKNNLNNDVSTREAACLDVQYPYMFEAPGPDDYFVGKYKYPSVYFLPQTYCNRGGAGFAYIFDEQSFSELIGLDDLNSDQIEKLNELAEFWRKENTVYKTREGYSKELTEAFPSDNWTDESGIAFPLYRMAGSQMNYDKLLRFGINGLTDIIHKKHEENDLPLYVSMLKALEVLKSSIRFYISDLSENIKSLKSQLIIATLKKILNHPPESLHEAIQLMFLYNSISGSLNFGRIDEYLGDFLVSDLTSGKISIEVAGEYIVGLWEMMAARNTIFDGRAVIGGKRRRNEINADQFALLAIDATRRTKNVLPQLTLRIYEGMNPEILKKAYDVIGEGNTFPMLYNDDANIPAVEKAFRVSKDEAACYTPYGCGEYVLYNKSYGTPSGIINLLKVLEVVLHDGVDPVSGQEMPVSTKKVEDIHSFEELWDSYRVLTEYYVRQLSMQEKFEYEMAAKHGAFLFMSILFDDCIEKGKSIFDGGIRYLGGTLETYGNTNTSDSLLAIKKFVFEEKKISLPELVKIMDEDFTDNEQVRRKLLSFPKYGNELAEADKMHEMVHSHICNYTRNQADTVGLQNYMVVIINNNANTVLGRTTMASADGRRKFTSMANGNAPSGGNDKNGITAMLNSVASPAIDIHAGMVQNVKFSKSMFKSHSDKVHQLLAAYFKNGGSQVMITVLGKNDLENALLYPENYPDLLVRVGGFSARFVELERDVQQEIISRTMY